MHFYCCNDGVPWLNEAKSQIFWCTVIFKNFQIHLYFVCHLPAVRPGSTTCTCPIFLTKNVIGVYNTNLLFRKRFIYCAMVIPFFLHWPSLFFSKMSNLQKKVLITPGLYFPNYCITYLPHDISRDFKVWLHELKIRVNVYSIRRVVINGNQSEDSWQKEGGLSECLEKSRAEQCSTKPWQLHERPRE